MDVNTMDHFEKREFLIRRKFLDGHRLKGYDGSNADRIARKDLFEAFTKRIKSMPLQELDMLCVEQKQLQRLERDEIARRSDQLAFFSLPDAEADFNYWDTLQKWKIE